MTEKCPICGSTNDEETKFCESCGTPIEENKGEEQKIPEIALGYTSSLREEPERKDNFLVIDTATLFGETKHRRILCVIVKGLAKYIDGRAITQDLLDDVLRNQCEIEYSSYLLEIQNKMKTDFGSFFSSEASEELKTGLLVGVIDNAQVNVLCMGAPTVLVSKSNGEEIIKSANNEAPLSLRLENNDCVCMSCSDLFDFVGKIEVLDIISKAENPQSACEALVSMMKEANAEVDFSLVLTRIRGLKLSLIG